jgi:hypothetical protein
MVEELKVCSPNTLEQFFKIFKKTDDIAINQCDILQKAELESETLREETAEELALVVSPQTKRAPSPLPHLHPGTGNPDPVSSSSSLLISVSPTDESLLLPGDSAAQEDSSVSLGEFFVSCTGRTD